MTELQQAVTFLSSEYGWFIDELEAKENEFWLEYPDGNGEYVTDKELIEMAQEQWITLKNNGLNSAFIKEIEKWYPILK